MTISWTVLEKETVDEIIFRTTKVRNRLILELMARGGMRIGEVLKLRFVDIQGRYLILKEPKSGKELEIVFIPQKVADRLRGDPFTGITLITKGYKLSISLILAA